MLTSGALAETNGAAVPCGVLIIGVAMHNISGPRRATAGFTLIELMIAVAIVAILVSVALPFFQDSIRKSRRSDAFKWVSATQQSAERWRSNNAQYSTSLTDLAIVVPADSNYTVAVSTPPSPDDLKNGYIVTATATGSQVNDTQCAAMAVLVKNGNVIYGSGSSIDWSSATPDSNRCWVR